MHDTFSLNNFFSRCVRVSPLAIMGITLTLDERACRVCTSCAFKLNIMGESLVNTALPTNQKLQYSVLRMASRCYKVQTCMYSGINFMTSNSDGFFCVPISLILLTYVSDNRFNAANKLKGKLSVGFELIPQRSIISYSSVRFIRSPNPGVSITHN